MEESDKAYLERLNSAGSFSSVSSFSSSITSSSSFMSKSLLLRPDGAPDFRNDHKCHICDKKFSLTNRRHHCRYCGNSICEEHGIKRRIKEDQKRIRMCDNCDRDMISGEIKDEIQNEILRLQMEIQHGREMNERLSKEHSEKYSRVNTLETELVTAGKSQKIKEQALQDKLTQELERGGKARSAVDDLRKELEDSHKLESDIRDRCEEYESKLANLRSESETLRERKEELVTQIDHLTNRLKGSLPIDQIKQILCARCQQNLIQTYRPFSMNGIPTDEDAETA